MNKKNRFMLIFIFPILIFSFLALPVWQIKKVEIQGKNLVPEETPKNAFVFENENIFFFNHDKISAEDFPQIKKISYRRRLPSTLIVIIEKREPFALCKFNNPVLIDEEGVIVESNKNQNKNDLLVIRGLQEKEIETGRILNSETFSLIKQIFTSWNNIASEKIKEIDLSDRKNLGIFLGEVKIKLGNNLQFFRKRKSVELLLTNLGGITNRIEYMDVSVPLSPVAKFKNVKI
jgi:cell division septal protein FtsQ